MVSVALVKDETNQENTLAAEGSEQHEQVGGNDGYDARPEDNGKNIVEACEYFVSILCGKKTYCIGS